MTPAELRTAADDLNRLEELEPRPGRVALADRLRRGAEWLVLMVDTSQKPDSSPIREVSIPIPVESAEAKETPR